MSGSGAIGSSRRRIVAGAVAILLLTFGAYSFLLYGHAGFIWDDPDYVINNTTLRTASGLIDIWFHPTSLPQWYPLVHTTFWLEYHAWGLDAIGYHATNIALHALSALLLWRLLRRVGIPGAWLAACVFAVHPVMVESVAWVTERKNVLSLFFYLLAMHVYLFRSGAGLVRPDGEQKIDWRWWSVALALFLCALFSKTVTATWPAAILLILWWKRGRIRWRDVAWLIPFFVVALILSQVTAYLEVHHVGADGTHIPELRLSIAQRVLIAGRVIGFYAWKLVWPANLTFIYPRWNVDPRQWMQWLAPLGVAIVLLSLVALTWLRLVGRGVLTAVLFFCGTLFPALGFVNVYPMRFSFVADHFQYHASIGLIVLIVALLWWAIDRLKPGGRGRWAFHALLSFVILAPLAYLAWSRTHVYANAETLWRDTEARNPDEWMVQTNLAHALRDRGALDEAAPHYFRALELRPDLHDTHANVAMLLGARGENERAIAEAKRALEINPDFAPAHYTLGQIYAHQGKYADAVRELTRAIELAPSYPEANFRLGVLLETKGDLVGAIEHYRVAVANAPEDFEMRYNLGTACLTAKRYDEAAANLAEAVRIDPSSAPAWTNLGAAQMRLGMRAAAIASFRRALQIDPTLVPARRSLDAALRGM